jgi:hypothetical protein
VSWPERARRAAVADLALTRLLDIVDAATVKRHVLYLDIPRHVTVRFVYTDNPQSPVRYILEPDRPNGTSRSINPSVDTVVLFIALPHLFQPAVEWFRPAARRLVLNVFVHPQDRMYDVRRFKGHLWSEEVVWIFHPAERPTSLLYLLKMEHDYQDPESLFDSDDEAPPLVEPQNALTTGIQDLVAIVCDILNCPAANVSYTTVVGVENLGAVLEGEGSPLDRLEALSPEWHAARVAPQALPYPRYRETYPGPRTLRCLSFNEYEAEVGAEQAATETCMGAYAEELAERYRSSLNT